ERRIADALLRAGGCRKREQSRGQDDGGQGFHGFDPFGIPLWKVGCTTPNDPARFSRRSVAIVYGGGDAAVDAQAKPSRSSQSRRSRMLRRLARKNTSAMLPATGTAVTTESNATLAIMRPIT